MKDLIVFGIGGFGRELAEWLFRSEADRRRYNVLGFLDDNPAHHGTEVLGLPVLGDMRWLEQRPGTQVLVGVGTSVSRWRVVQRLRQYDVGFPVLIDPSAVVVAAHTLGEGTVVCPQAVITTNATVGRFVLVNLFAAIAHDSVAADFVSLSPSVQMLGNTQAGEGTDLGTGTILIPGVRVGRWCVTGAGAVVTRSVADNAVIVGVPAAVRKEREEGWHLPPTPAS